MLGPLPTPPFPGGPEIKPEPPLHPEDLLPLCGCIFSRESREDTSTFLDSHATLELNVSSWTSHFTFLGLAFSNRKMKLLDQMDCL